MCACASLHSHREQKRESFTTVHVYPLDINSELIFDLKLSALTIEIVVV